MSEKNLRARKMGLDNPYIARGVNPHETHRQSAFTIDGPAIAGVLYGHDLVIVDSASGMPGFFPIPTGDDKDGFGLALKAFAESRGATIAENDEAAIEPALAFFRDRLFLIWNGNEHAEMPLLTSQIQDNIDGKNDAGVQLRACYLTGVLAPAIPDIDSAVRGGSLCIVVNDLTGEVSLGASGTQKADHTAFNISGTTIVNVYEKEDNTGQTNIYVDLTC